MLAPCGLLTIICFVLVWFIGYNGTRYTFSRALLQTKPVNEAVFAGKTTRLTCVVNGTAATRITWRHYVNASHYDVIASGFHLLLSARKYAVSIANGLSKLDIKQVESMDCGRYACVDVYSGDIAFAELIVLESPLDCSGNDSSNETVAGDRLRYVCSLRYSGLWAPIIRWQIAILGVDALASMQTANETHPGEASYSLEFTARPEHNGRQLRADAWFDQPRRRIAENSSTVKPNYQHTQMMAPMNILHGPINIKVTPSRLVYYRGEIVKIHARANPVAVYWWHDLLTNHTVMSAFLRVTRRMYGPQTYMAFAANNVRGAEKIASLQVDFTARKYRRTSTVAVAGMVLGLSSVCLVCIVIGYYTLLDRDRRPTFQTDPRRLRRPRQIWNTAGPPRQFANRHRPTIVRHRMHSGGRRSRDNTRRSVVINEQDAEVRSIEEDVDVDEEEEEEEVSDALAVSQPEVERQQADTSEVNAPEQDVVLTDVTSR